MDYSRDQQNSSQHEETAESGDTHSNTRGTISSADDGSARNNQDGENKHSSKNSDTTEQQKNGDKENDWPKPPTDSRTETQRDAMDHNTINNDDSVSSTGSDDIVTSKNAGSDDTKPAMSQQQQTGTILAPRDHPELPGADFVSFKPQRRLARGGQENAGRRTEEEPRETPQTLFGSVSESGSCSSIELPSLGAGPGHRSRHAAREGRGDEPVLTLYRRHSEDPFSMYNYAITNVPASDTSFQRTDHTSVDMNHYKYNHHFPESSTPRVDNDNSYDEAVLSSGGLEKGTAVTVSRGQPAAWTGTGTADWRSRSAAGHEVKEVTTGGHVSLNGIHVGVKKKPPATKMAKMQSPRVQCCMCAVSVMSALFGMFMLSAGVCLVLNYNFLEVDTSGLPPNLHNEEGKKVVGIILICVGIAALGVSGLVSIIFYTACSRSSTSSSSSKKGEEGEGRPSSQESQARHGHYNSNGTTPARPPSSNGVSGGRRSGGAAAPLPNGRRGNGSREGAAAGAAAYGRAGSSSGSVAGRNGTPPSASRPYRPGKKSRHHGPGRFRNSLPSHPEEAGGEGQTVGESRHSAPPSSSSRRLTFPDRSGHVNQGAQLDDDVDVASGSSSESSVTPPVVITVDSSYLNEKAPSSQSPSNQHGQSDSELTKHSSGAGASSEVPSVSSSGPVEMRHKNSARNNFKEEEEEEEESGRMSRSTVTSSEATEGVEESAEDASKRLDAEMSTLLS